MKIAIFGTGYVGLSNAILLAQHNEVVAVDIVEDKVRKINQRVSPISDNEIEEYLNTKQLNLRATLDAKDALLASNFAVIATPTNYNPETNSFDTSSVEFVLDEISKISPNTTVVIKSTIPVGYTKQVQSRYPMKIIFSPEFLREGKALYDNLYPSRIIVGDKSAEGQCFGRLLQEAAIKKNVPLLLMGSTEAEAVKLFANTYLAMRVSFFNELDSYSYVNDLDVKEIIQGVGLDPRIGSHYQNPSFGYGGYCLPKDTKELLASYGSIPQTLIGAIVKSNEIRKKFIFEKILSKNPQVVGVYRLVMKQDSDNFRESAIFDIINMLKSINDIKVIIYEPLLEAEAFDGLEVVNDLNTFKTKADLIVANRSSNLLTDVKEKIFTRDLFGNN
ncbi:nucleotide sugar dehydrogenase [uncultured Parasutterella sp.]|uniref:nucleotide sugar dehydrogenase n=1 Tax=uncultured Parasutterella sp. TaxID=1263098 RepID=UPI00272D1EE2|nr:nucleotide sugar dehydrogenase [uncultured Parasutterella sp.]